MSERVRKAAAVLDSIQKADAFAEVVEALGAKMADMAMRGVSVGEMAKQLHKEGVLPKADAGKLGRLLRPLIEAAEAAKNPPAKPARKPRKKAGSAGAPAGTDAKSSTDGRAAG